MTLALVVERSSKLSIQHMLYSRHWSYNHLSPKYTETKLKAEYNWSGLPAIRDGAITNLRHNLGFHSIVADASGEGGSRRYLHDG